MLCVWYCISRCLILVIVGVNGDVFGVNVVRKYCCMLCISSVMCVVFGC